jgi:DNA-binding cell septation regulator SpoVG
MTMGVTYKVTSLTPYREAGPILALADVTFRLGDLELNTSGWRVVRCEQTGLYAAAPSHHQPGEGQRRSIDLPATVRNKVLSDILRRFLSGGAT